MTSVPPPLPGELAGNIGGFWRRFLAALIDSAILSIPAFCLGIVLFAQFARLGGWGRLVGFLIALIYYGFMNSVVGHGQTFGKRLMRIRVVGLDASPISIPRSFLRYFILGTPFFLNGAAIPPRLIDGWIGIVIGVVIFGVGGSIIYLAIFNRRNRRSLHDLIAGTYVVKTADGTDSIRDLIIWPGHYVIATLLVSICIAGPIFLKGLVAQWGYKDLIALQAHLMDKPDIWYAAVFSGKNFATNATGMTSSTTTAVGVWVKRPIDNYDAFANNIAKTALAIFPNAERADRLVVNITYGYDLGLATTHTSRSFAYSPSNWHARINGH